MRRIYQHVCQWTDCVRVADGVGDYICCIKYAEKPEVSSSSSSSNEPADQRQYSQAEMPNIDERRHAEQAEHLPIWVHDAGDVIQRVNRQKECSVGKGALLNC